MIKTPACLIIQQSQVCVQGGIALEARQTMRISTFLSRERTNLLLTYHHIQRKKKHIEQMISYI